MAFNLTKTMKNLSTKKDLHLLRKLAHGTTGIILYLWLSSTPSENEWKTHTIFLFSMVGLSIDLVRFKSPRFNQILLKAFRFLARDEEQNRFSGMTTYFVAASLCLLISSATSIAPFFLIVAIADPLASIMGLKIKSPLLFKQKSVAGLMTYFLTSTLIFGCLNWTIHQSLFFGFILALTETFVPFDDNLSVPLLGTIALTLSSTISLFS